VRDAAVVWSLPVPEGKVSFGLVCLQQLRRRRAMTTQRRACMPCTRMYLQQW